MLSLALAGGSALAASLPPVPKTCPSAATVKSFLGGSAKTPTTTLMPYARICTYAGGGIIPTRISFQEDTKQTFLASESAVPKSIVENVKGLGQAAWATNVGGSIYVFTGKYTIKILAPLVSLKKLEALARKLL